MWKRWNGPRLQTRFNEATDRAMEQALEVVGGVSDQQVPHDEGTLQQSKTIRVVNGVGKIGYGGGPGTGWPVVPYAIKWHETPANFQKGRKHNYLREPFHAEFPRALRETVRRNRL